MYYVAKDDHEFLILLSSFSKYRRVLMCLVYVMLKMESRSSYMLGKHFTN